MADLALELGLDGIIATNTTISRDGLRTAAAYVTALGAGGISGRPVAARSLAVLQRIRARVGTALCIISVGGIATGDDAWARITAGATLVQGYTGLIYGGPAWANVSASSSCAACAPPASPRSNKRLAALHQQQRW